MSDNGNPSHSQYSLSIGYVLSFELHFTTQLYHIWVSMWTVCMHINVTTDFLPEIFVGSKTPPNISTLFSKGVLSHFSVKICLWVVSA